MFILYAYFDRIYLKILTVTRISHNRPYTKTAGFSSPGTPPPLILYRPLRFIVPRQTTPRLAADGLDNRVGEGLIIRFPGLARLILVAIAQFQDLHRGQVLRVVIMGEGVSVGFVRVAARP